MKAWILYHNWDTPDTEGSEVLGVWTDELLDEAKETMRVSAKTVMDGYEDDFWDDDFTWEDDLSIHLGHDPMILGELATIYSWELCFFEVQGA